MQDKPASFRQAFSAEKQCLDPFYLRELACQRHSKSRFTEKLCPHTVSAFFGRGDMVGQNDGGFARTQGFDDLLNALNTGRRGFTFAAWLFCLYIVKGLSLRRNRVVFTL